MMDEKMKELLDLCVEVEAHCELDWEVTVGGNGTNSSEAVNVTRAILRILKIKPTGKRFRKMVDDRIKELKVSIGEDELDEDDG